MTRMRKLEISRECFAKAELTFAKTQYVMTYFVANIYAALGDKEKAFAELEKAFAERDFSLHRLNLDPLMDSLRSDPRFQDLLRRVGLAQ